MITHSVDITIYCDRAANIRLNERGYMDNKDYVQGCLHEDTLVYDKFVRNPAQKAIQQWKKEGWLIEKDKTLCPACKLLQK